MDDRVFDPVPVLRNETPYLPKLDLGDYYEKSEPASLWTDVTTDATRSKMTVLDLGARDGEGKEYHWDASEVSKFTVPMMWGCATFNLDNYLTNIGGLNLPSKPALEKSSWTGRRGSRPSLRGSRRTSRSHTRTCCPSGRSRRLAPTCPRVTTCGFLWRD